MKNLPVLSFIAAVSLLSSSLAQTTTPPSTGAPAGTPPPTAGLDQAGAKAPATSAPKPAGFPFRGKLKSVDKGAMTLTIAGQEKDRIVHLTQTTKFTKDAKPATLADAVVDQEVAGYAQKGKEGRTEAISVRFGPAVKPAKPTKEPAKKKGKAGEGEAEPMP